MHQHRACWSSIKRAVMQDELLYEVEAMAKELKKSHPGIHTTPVDILCCSAQDNVGVNSLQDAIRSMLYTDNFYEDDDIVDWDTSLPDH